MASFEEDFRAFVSAVAIALFLIGAVYVGAHYFGQGPVKTASAVSMDRVLPSGIPSLR
jgi:hypothetical protein